MEWAEVDERFIHDPTTCGSSKSGCLGLQKKCFMVISLVGPIHLLRLNLFWRVGNLCNGFFDVEINTSNPS